MKFAGLSEVMLMSRLHSATTTDVLQQRRFFHDVCVFCLNRAAAPRFAAGFNTRTFASSLTVKQEDVPSTVPRRFGDFANRARDSSEIHESSIDWGDTRERAAVANTSKTTRPSPQLDDPLQRPTDDPPNRPLVRRTILGNGVRRDGRSGEDSIRTLEERSASKAKAAQMHWRNMENLPRRNTSRQEDIPRQSANASDGESAGQAQTSEHPGRKSASDMSSGFKLRKYVGGPAQELAGTSKRSRFTGSHEQTGRSFNFSPTKDDVEGGRKYNRSTQFPTKVPLLSVEVPIHHPVPDAERTVRHRPAKNPRPLQTLPEDPTPTQEDVIIQQADSRARARRLSQRFQLDNDIEMERRKRPAEYPARKGPNHAKGEHRAQKYEEVEEADDLFDHEQLEARREKKKKRKVKKGDRDAAIAAAPKNAIELPAFISVQSLATALRVRPDDFVQKLEELGFEDVAMDHVLNSENAGLVAMEYGLEPLVDRSPVEDLQARPALADTSDLPLRPPIVTIMGHVDHGKTTLLDFLRKSSVAASEHGGITQHIGAFSVPIASAGNRLVTFLDTPGHAAFLSMRQRGANVTDIVVLVVAADDSVKPQTIEAIKHAKSAGVQIIVAISKTDKDSADPQRVKTDLLQHDVEVEDLGGSIQAIEVSGKTGHGIADLEEAIITLADILEMRADVSGPPEGWILEAATKRSGRTATVLVRRGTLHIGDVIVAGTAWARVRSLVNEAGARIVEASPGMPVEVDGWREQPTAGDEVLGTDSEQRASEVVDFRRVRAERIQAGVDIEAINASRKSLAERHALEKDAAAEAVERLRAGTPAGGYVRGKDIIEARRAATAEARREYGTEDETTDAELYVVVKADVGGSTEAVVGGIQGLPLERQPVGISILRSGVGAVSESDVAFAAAAPAGQGFIINFNQELPAPMAALAERSGVQVLSDSVIYKIIDGVRAEVEARLPPLVTKRVLGEAEAVQCFEIKGSGKSITRIAGCRVKNGLVQRSEHVRVFRGGVGGELVFEGRLASLKNVKKDVLEMRKGMECGMAFEGWDGFADGDVIQCYEEIHETRKLM